MQVRHIHTPEAGEAYLAAFGAFMTHPSDPYSRGSLELSSDGDMPLEDSYNTGFYYWAVPETPFR